MQKKNREIKMIFTVLAIFFAAFLAVPMVQILMKSLVLDGSAGFTLANYREILGSGDFQKALGNSFLISGCSAVLTTVLAFFLAYTVHYTNVKRGVKNLITKAAVLPMLIPTITYGFAIIYSFGKQGLLTQLFGRQFFDIYGFNGLLMGYVIYTLPISFMLIHNTMGYIDKKFMIVSRLMGDSPFQTFRMTILRPLLGTLATSFIQTFFLCFTDFGIPASVGGSFEVVASVLYTEMLGSVPDFGNGAVVALIMLVPSIVSITVLTILERYNVRYNRISQIELKKGKVRDWVCGLESGVILAAVLSVFLVIFVVPFVDEWPYRMEFTLEHVNAVFSDYTLSSVYTNSLMVAFATALIGTLMSYGAALITARSTVHSRIKGVIESIALVTNTIYVDSAQEQNNMFKDLDFEVNTMDEYPSYCAPITAQEGTIIVNTEMMEENNLPMPTSLKDLADPEYEGFISVTDIASSSTAWLLIQGLISEYGEDGAKEVLTGIYANAGDHIEDSGSAPLKKVRAGEVAIGFGLRQQAVADKADGLPIDYVDPAEGNFSLTESVAVIDKGEESKDLAMEMAQCIIENGREEELQSYYPLALYEGESTDSENMSANPKVFSEPLTVDLLEKHQELSESCK